MEYRVNYEDSCPNSKGTILVLTSDQKDVDFNIPAQTRYVMTDFGLAEHYYSNNEKLKMLEFWNILSEWLEANSTIRNYLNMDVRKLFNIVSNVNYTVFCIENNASFFSRRSMTGPIVTALTNRGHTLFEIDHVLSNDQKFDEMCEWNGLINRGLELRQWMKIINS